MGIAGAFCELLRAEATTLSVAKNLIDVLGSITARMLHCKTRPRVFVKQTFYLTNFAHHL
jgi:hypothetical protein